MNTTFSNIYKIDRDEFNDLSLFYSYFKKSTINIEKDNIDFIEKPQYYHWLTKKEDNQNTSYSECIKYHIELIYQEENRILLIDEPELSLHSSQISSWVTWLSPEIKNETNESRKILARIIKKLSLQIKIKVKKNNRRIK